MMAVSLRSRLTIWYTLVLVAVLLAFGAQLVWTEGRIGLQRIDRELADVQATMAKIIGHELLEDMTATESAEVAAETVAERNLATLVLDERGATLTANALAAELINLHPIQGDIVSSVQTPSGGWRVRSRAEKIGGADFTIVVAGSLSDVERGQRQLREAMLIGAPVVLLLAGAGGWWLASIGLAPISQMARRAVGLPLGGADDLGAPARDDELGQLTRAFNGLVARLRAALHTQRRFMADASHELRTPVSIIRSAADVALDREGRSEMEYRDAIAIARDQALRLGRLVEDMLVLARADAGGYPIRAVDLDLDEVVDECRRGVRALANERGVEVRFSAGPELPYRGDPDLVRRLVLNLLQNAIQHTRAGGIVVVTIQPDPDVVSVRVSDGGPGIPEADRKRIFDRFVRLDEARSGNGAGLGLSIAKWIAEAHGGTLALEATGPGGSTFRATLSRRHHTQTVATV